MQTNTGTGRPAKKIKLADDNVITNVLPTNGAFKEPAIDNSTSETAAEIFTHLSAFSQSATSEPIINKLYIDNTNTVEAPESSNAADLPTSATHIQIEDSEIINLSPKGDIFLITHGDGLTILNEYFKQFAIGSDSVNNAEGFNK
jgi:hypothetical protein